jgi:phosphoadenosine phosphosulfate reductase
MRSLEEVLSEALERHGERGVVMLCSFQKEESVILDALLELQPQARVATIDTGVLFPETLATWREYEERWGVEIEVADASGAWTGPDNCCATTKVRALNEALMGSDGWITGLRREQSPTRAHAEQVEYDDARGMWKYNPLAHWTDDEVWKRVMDRELPYNALHDEGYASIGCAPCTQPGDGREGRWAGMAKTECGLHI